LIKAARLCIAQVRRLRLSLFEKVILANSLMLIGEALAGLWVTSHNVEAHHYLIDTGFIVLATLLGLLVNYLLLRASFRPLFGLLHTMRAVSAGAIHKRAPATSSDTEITELARAFNSMLDRLEAARREQAMLTLQAQEEERHRLALELHDESSQNLTALLVHAEVLSQSLQALPDTEISEDVRAQLDQGLTYLTRLTHHTLDDIRALAQQLRPSVLDDLGLLAAFRWLAEDGRQRLQLAVELHIDSIEGVHRAPPRGREGFETRYPSRSTHREAQSLSPRQGDRGILPGGQVTKGPYDLYETALFRIAQESLTNVARHAHAQHVTISLTQDQEQIYLQVRDDGRGFDSAQQHAGLGIFGMHERAELLGGTVTIQSQPGQGTMVRAVLPLSTSKGEEHA
jgi:two-component system sensor histidine kinase UhpB